ncbi:RNA 2'-phosphotransferase, partial [Neisseria sp. P0009.S008]
MILNEKQLKSISKVLSFILRHHPEQIGITLDKD